MVPKHQADLGRQRLTLQDPAPDLENFGTLRNIDPSTMALSKMKCRVFLVERNKNLSFFDKLIEETTSFGTFCSSLNIKCWSSEVPAMTDPVDDPRWPTSCNIQSASESTSANRLNSFIPQRIHGAGIYANIWGILMVSMLPYIAAPWILWVHTKGNNILEATEHAVTVTLHSSVTWLKY